MTSNKHAARLGAAAAAFTLAACADTTGPDDLADPVLADMAVVAADAAIESFTLARMPLGFAAVVGPGQGRMTPGQPGGQRGIGGKLSGVRERTFFDAAGQEQDAYDPLTTATIRVLIDIEGSVERESWSAEIDRFREMTITGLEGEEATRTFNGSGEEEISRSRHLDDGTVRTYTLTGTFTKTDVVVPVPGSDPPWPLSGTVHRVMKVVIVNGPDGDVTRDVDVTITFDGDATASGVINGEPFEVDLSARRGRNPLRGRRGNRPSG